MRELKFRARFRHIRTRKEFWQQSKVNHKLEDADSLIQLTDWEQLTGLKDCKRTEEYPKGQEIYEGDILKASDSIIKIRHRGRGFEGVYLNKKQIHEVPILNNNYLHWEIIGNIHQNKDLLK